ncbi:hypothetical protein AAMO2058_000527800 [Amorphochlora amoebiformis]
MSRTLCRDRKKMSDRSMIATVGRGLWALGGILAIFSLAYVGIQRNSVGLEAGVKNAAIRPRLVRLPPNRGGARGGGCYGPVTTRPTGRLGDRLGDRLNVRAMGDPMGYDPGMDTSAPMEVDWSQDLANSVNLIGNLGADPQVSYLTSGKVVAKVSIAVTSTPNKTNWFDCEMWNQLARSAQQHLQKGSKVHIRGRLEKDSWNDKITGERRTRVKIVATAFNTVRPYVPMGASSPSPEYSSTIDAQAHTSQGNSQDNYSPQRTAEEKWNDFFKEPDQYWDNRALKQTGERSPKYPDFKHKTTQEALWIDSWDSPKWVKAILTQMDDAAKDHEAAIAMGDLGGGIMDEGKENDPPSHPKW